MSLFGVNIFQYCGVFCMFCKCFITFDLFFSEKKKKIQNPTTRRAVGIAIAVFDKFLGKKRIKCRPINNS